jgi:hypothetical protein
MVFSPSNFYLLNTGYTCGRGGGRAIVADFVERTILFAPNRPVRGAATALRRAAPKA